MPGLCQDDLSYCIIKVERCNETPTSEKQDKGGGVTVQLFICLFIFVTNGQCT